MPLMFVAGDATAPDPARPGVLAHVCNDAGKWGAGFVLALSRRWPQPEREYRAWYAGRAGNDFALGAAQIVRVEAWLEVANMVAQHGLRSARNPVPLRLDALEQCLTRVATHATQTAADVHMPRIGAGLGGGRWEDIAGVIEGVFAGRPTRVIVYDLPTPHP
jgi:O-acetyl-ADP-ribose deacetylase (regulator of RNase III)